MTEINKIFAISLPRVSILNKIELQLIKDNLFAETKFGHTLNAKWNSLPFYPR